MKDIPQIWSSWDARDFKGDNKARAYVTVEKNWYLNSVNANTASFSTDSTWPTPDRIGPWRYYQNYTGTTVVTSPATGTNYTITWAFNQTGGWDANAENLSMNFYEGGIGDPFVYTFSDSISVLQAWLTTTYGAGNATASKIDNVGVEQSVTISYDFETYFGSVPALPVELGGFGANSFPATPYYDESTVAGTYDLPIYNNLETEIPNVRDISIDRSLDTDAASCKISIYNTVPAVGFGDPVSDGGYFTFNRGDSDEAAARWGHEANDWNNTLVPMALIRTYQGFGGTGVLADDIADGYVTITGTWFVDKVIVGTNGLLELTCRDAAKLLIEQMVYPPLIPASISPLKYYRYKDTTYNAIWDPGGGLGPKGTPPVPITFANTSMDVLAGNSAFGFAISPYTTVLGYAGNVVADGSDTTWSIGPGYVSPSASHVADWWEVSVNSQINKVYVSPWGGGYTCFVSVMENGQWQDVTNIPYLPGTPDGLMGSAYVTDDSAANIPYVTSSGLSFDTPTTIELPRTYNAQRVRITLRDHKVGGGFQSADTLYRSGLREIAVSLSNTSVQPWTFAIASNSQANGYWAISLNGQIFPFGETSDQLTDANPGITHNIVAAQAHPTQQGFYTLEQNGRVHAYSMSGYNVPYYGDSSASGFTDFIDIGVTHTGLGYWLLRSSGGVITFGDAEYMSGTYNGSSTLGEIPTDTVDPSHTATAIAGHPTAMGYWVVGRTGKVGAFGAASNVGEVTPPLPTGIPAAIEPTETGDGYWILWGNGQIFNYGDATNQGQSVTGSGYGGIWWDLARATTPLVTQGYWAIRADNQIGAFGARNFGQPGSTGATIRTDGNYLDYVDIIKDLLGWAGFAVIDTSGMAFGEFYIQGIHGVLESTGVYSEEPLSEDIFDKKPVMDAIRTIKEIVGYVTWVDEVGGFHFQSPNWWAPGNFYEDMTRVSFIPEIDEEVQLFDYAMEFSDESLRSELIITNLLPTPENNNTITTRYTPPGQDLLRGLVRPAIWSNEVFNKASEQQIMAELIGMHIWFAQRQGQTTCVANPCLQINDQVRIWERNTGESYIHFVRGISTNQNLDTGEYVMTLTTHWLGSDSSWVISTGTPSNAQNQKFYISSQLVEYLANSGSYSSDPTYFLGFAG